MINFFPITEDKLSGEEKVQVTQSSHLLNLMLTEPPVVQTALSMECF